MHAGEVHNATREPVSCSQRLVPGHRGLIPTVENTLPDLADVGGGKRAEPCAAPAKSSRCPAAQCIYCEM